MSNRTYTLLFGLLGVIYVIGLFLPLIDNDSAHHANIGLRMYLTGDYVNMIDHRGDYIDKPHFLFWISALSYEIFGVNSFAYRFPSFLFTIAGTYFVYRLGKALYNEETGKLAALIAASSFCYILANSDVRMDAILTACIAFSLWQLVEFIHHKKLKHLALATIGMAVGFVTKGHVGFVTPAAGAFFYIIYRKEWKLLYDTRWLFMILFFLLLIAPVVYCFYLQFDLHPEKISQGMKGVSGVKYILWSHSIDRITGHERFGTMGKADRLYFLHTFLWTFAPWSVIMFAGVIIRFKHLLTRKFEWLSTGIFLMLAILINFSYFKLPHYLPILAPVSSIIAAHFILFYINDKKRTSILFYTQLFICLLVLIAVSIVNAWAFPVTNALITAGTIILLSVLFYFLLSARFTRLQKSIFVSAFTMVLVFFLLYTNFYPKLLEYQGGKYLADNTRDSVDPSRVYFWKNTFSSSYNFYSVSNRQVFHDSLLNSKSRYWIIYDKSQQASLDSTGINYRPSYSHKDFEISRMNLKFFNPSTRKEVLGEIMIAEVN